MFLEESLDSSLHQGESSPGEEDGHRDFEVIEDLPKLGVVRNLVRPAYMDEHGKQKTFHHRAEDNIRTEVFRCRFHEFP